MATSKEVSGFLDKYFFTLSDKERLEFESRGYDTWGFGGSKEYSDRLVNLVLKGKKRGTASLYSKKDKIPSVGSYGVVIDADGVPKCLVKYTNFEIKPFNEVGSGFAQEEGEDSGDLGDWKEEHQRFFQNENPKFTETSLVLCESFKLVFKSV